MDIKKVFDEFIKAELAEGQEKDERKRDLCELLLKEFKQMTVEDLLKCFESMVLYKKAPRIVLTLSFLVTFNDPS